MSSSRCSGFVALTNAFNLLDGLDGVAAGVGAIASFFLGLTFAQQGHWLHASVAWSLTGATLGSALQLPSRFHLHGGRREPVHSARSSPDSWCRRRSASSTVA